MDFLQATGKYLTTAALFVHLLLQCCISLAAPLPDMGIESDQYLSPAQEKALGEAMMREIRRRMPLIDDPLITQYIQSLGNQLASANANKVNAITLFVIHDTAINAFAAPGGYIGINSGLFVATETESELAGVIAHEIGHVSQRHISRRFSEMEKLSLPRAAALLAGILITSVDPEAGLATIAAADAASAQNQLSFSRSNEREADRIGFQILQQSGFDPHGMVTFFKTMAQMGQISGEPVEFLSTHPLTVDRIADMENRVRFITPQIPGYSDTHYYLMREHINVLTSSDPTSSVNYYQHKLKTRPATSVYRYALALSLLTDGKYKQSEKLFSALLKENELIPYFIGLARSKFGQKQLNESISVYRQSLDLFPGDYSITYYLSKTLIAAGKPQEALRILRTFLGAHKNAIPLYYLAAEAAADSGDQALSYRMLADYAFGNGHYQKALQYLDKALEISPKGSNATAAHLARKREIEAQMSNSVNSHL